MSVAMATPPLTRQPRLVVDTDVVSYVFKWHPKFAPAYVDLIRGSELVVSFMTVAEMRQGSLEARWGQGRRKQLELYLSEFGILHSDGALCSIWAEIRRQRSQLGRPIGGADAWIAATAILLAAPLVTNNAKDFAHLKQLEVRTIA